jgi:DNA-directed RNA polymerase alpha subunit
MSENEIIRAQRETIQSQRKLIAMLEKELSTYRGEVTETEEKPHVNKTFDELSIRTKNVLKNIGFAFPDDLIFVTEQFLMCVPNLGRKSLNEIKENSVGTVWAEKYDEKLFRETMWRHAEYLKKIKAKD